jgi:penicillin amidase
VIEAPMIDGVRRRLVGLTLPGVFAVVSGSNGSIAWGFTNSSGDFGEVIELKQPSPDSDQYLTPDGPQALQKVVEQIPIADGATRSVEHEWTIWGPVIHVRDGRRFVHRWCGHDAEAFNFHLIEMEQALSVEDAIDIATRTGIPQTNLVAVDEAGSIGWTICGRIPRRTAPPSLTPVDWSKGEGIWQGYLDPHEYPRQINPSSNRIWTANNRIVGGEALTLIGDGRYDLGARATRIRELLMARDEFDEQAMLAIQLDDKAVLMQRWQSLLQKVVQNHDNLVSREFVTELEDWGQHAAAESVGYRIVREFRIQVIDRLFGVDAPWRRLAQPGAFAKRVGIDGYVSVSHEDVLWQLIDTQPMHWLPAEFSDWNELLRAAAKATEEKLAASHPLAHATWGAENIVRIQHPLSRLVSVLSGWLDMPAIALPGDAHMPRVQGSTFGASQRLVVSPGHEADGIYHQPGGQSGHPYSEFYRDSFDDWAQGNPSPLLPGAMQHQLTLQPLGEKR